MEKFRERITQAVIAQEENVSMKSKGAWGLMGISVVSPLTGSQALKVIPERPIFERCQFLLEPDDLPSQTFFAGHFGRTAWATTSSGDVVVGGVLHQPSFGIEVSWPELSEDDRERLPLYFLEKDREI